MKVLLTFKGPKQNLTKELPPIAEKYWLYTKLRPIFLPDQIFSVTSGVWLEIIHEFKIELYCSSIWRKMHQHMYNSMTIFFYVNNAQIEIKL